MIVSEYLSEAALVTADDATAGGTTAVDSTGVDMTGYDGVLFVVKIGTAAANNTAKAQVSAVVGSGYADVSGVITAVSSKVLIVDVFRPSLQFARVEVTRGTSTTVDAIIAIRYKARNQPVTQTGALIKG